VRYLTIVPPLGGSAEYAEPRTCSGVACRSPPGPTARVDGCRRRKPVSAPSRPHLNSARLRLPSVRSCFTQRRRGKRRVGPCRATPHLASGTRPPPLSPGHVQAGLAAESRLAASPQRWDDLCPFRHRESEPRRKELRCPTDFIDGVGQCRSGLCLAALAFLVLLVLPYSKWPSSLVDRGRRGTGATRARPSAVHRLEHRAGRYIPTRSRRLSNTARLVRVGDQALVGLLRERAGRRCWRRKLA